MRQDTHKALAATIIFRVSNMDSGTDTELLLSSPKISITTHLKFQKLTEVSQLSGLRACVHKASVTFGSSHST